MTADRTFLLETVWQCVENHLPVSFALARRKCDFRHELENKRERKAEKRGSFVRELMEFSLLHYILLLVLFAPLCSRTSPSVFCLLHFINTKIICFLYLFVKAFSTPPSRTNINSLLHRIRVAVKGKDGWQCTAVQVWSEVGTAMKVAATEV